MKMQKGFTLIEILIVVVIIAILAALILPRFLQQPERAIIAEAQQTLGAIRRAQIANADLIGAAANTYIAATDTAAAVPDAGWGTLGLQDLGTSSRFNYVCVVGVDATGAAANPAAGDAGTCTATRAVNIGGAAADTITISNSRGTYACAGAYGAMAAAPNTNGCTFTNG